MVAILCKIFALRNKDTTCHINRPYEIGFISREIKWGVTHIITPIPPYILAVVFTTIYLFGLNACGEIHQFLGEIKNTCP